MIRVNENLVSGKASVYPLDLFSGAPQSYKIARCQDLLAIANCALVVLHDLQERNELWSCPLQLREHHAIEQLQVSPFGQVIVTSRFANERDAHIFSDGKDLGNMDLRRAGLINRLDMINGCFWALSPSNNQIYVSDRNGKSVCIISPVFLHSWSPQFVLFNESHYVVITNPSSPHEENISAYQHEKVEWKRFNFCFSLGQLVHAHLDGFTLICAYKNYVTQINLLTDHRKTYPYEWNFGPHASLFMHREYLIVSDPDDTHGLWGIHPDGNNRIRLVSDLVEAPQLSSSDDLLTACYKNEGLHVVVIDVFNATTLKHFVYTYHPEESVSFLKGKLLIFNENNGSIYVEDYENTQSKEGYADFPSRRRIGPTRYT